MWRWQNLMFNILSPPKSLAQNLSCLLKICRICSKSVTFAQNLLCLTQTLQLWVWKSTNCLNRKCASAERRNLENDLNSTNNSTFSVVFQTNLFQLSAETSLHYLYFIQKNIFNQLSNLFLNIFKLMTKCRSFRLRKHQFSTLCWKSFFL